MYNKDKEMIKKLSYYDKFFIFPEEDYINITEEKILQKMFAKFDKSSSKIKQEDMRDILSQCIVDEKKEIPGQQINKKFLRQTTNNISNNVTKKLINKFNHYTITNTNDPSSHIVAEDNKEENKKTEDILATYLRVADMSKELSKVAARWEYVARAVEIRNAFRHLDGRPSQTLIFGNGDGCAHAAVLNCMQPQLRSMLWPKVIKNPTRKRRNPRRTLRLPSHQWPAALNPCAPPLLLR